MDHMDCGKAGERHTANMHRVGVLIAHAKRHFAEEDWMITILEKGVVGQLSRVAEHLQPMIEDTESFDSKTNAARIMTNLIDQIAAL